MTRTLADLVHVLARPHVQSNGDRIAYAEPLLDTLHGLIAPSAAGNGSSDGGGSSTKSRPPINLDAMSLWQDIAGKIDREWPYAGHPSTVKVPTTKKLQAWYNGAAQPQDALYLYELCVKWESRILEALHPTKQMPLQGACPKCRNTHVETDNEDGGVNFNTAIIAYPESLPVYAQCQVCSERWEHEELHTLRDLLA